MLYGFVGYATKRNTGKDNMDTTRIEFGLVQIKKGIRDIEETLKGAADNKPVTAKRRILLAPGHSSKRGGYPGRNGVYSEHDCTVMIAEMAKEGLAKLGFHANIYDPAIDNLRLDGQQAHDHDAYIAPHLNAYDADDDDEYSCVLVHPKGKPESFQLANSIAVKTHEALKTVNPKSKLFSPSSKHPGVYFRGVTVLSESERVTARSGVPCVLPESFFLDAYSDPDKVKLLCEKAAIGIANGVSEYFFMLDA
jgi:N-acetylmuramoyl-L-alanine amidase